jgi:oxidase EvaA
MVECSEMQLPADDYDRTLRDFRSALDQMGFDPGTRRSEHMLECLGDWSIHHTLSEVEAWFEQERTDCTMSVEDIPLNQTQGWVIEPDTGDVHHESGEFFTVHGIRVSLSETREVGSRGWDQPILEQVGYDGGLLGLLRQRFAGIPHYLVEAKAEPGNYELVQLSPTLQATFSNLKRAHGGRKPRFANVFESPESVGGTVLHRQWLSEDGGRLHKKRNLGMLVEVPEGYVEQPPEHFTWMSMYQIKACLEHDAWVNPHIRGIIAHL